MNGTAMKRAARSLRLAPALRVLPALVALAAGALLVPQFLAAQAQSSPPDTRRSGFDYMTPSTQEMQRDDTQNPGMLWVKQGEALWSAKAGASGQSCASCHGEASSGMRGVAVRYPAFDAQLSRPITLSQRINQCRQQRQQAALWRNESQDLLSMESYVAY